MNRTSLAAAFIAIACAPPAAAQAQSCPPGQIFRVSLGVCQAKAAANAPAPPERGRPLLRPSAAEPAVGDFVVFGPNGPMLMKPDAARPVVRRPARRPAPAKRVAARPAAAKAAAPSGAKAARAVARALASPPAANSPRDEAELRKRVSAFLGQLRIADPKVEEAVLAEVRKAETAPAPGRSDRPPPAHDSVAEAPGATRIARSSEPAEQPAAAGPPLKPPAALEPSVEAGPPAAAEKEEKQARLDAGAQSSGSAAPTTASLPDWGDEKKLVETLRADWKGKPVTRSFHRGDEVPADVPLQPLPPPFASRAAGVNMNYLIANNDAVLVLPNMRVVVDVYHSPTASTADR